MTVIVRCLKIESNLRLTRGEGRACLKHVDKSNQLITPQERRRQVLLNDDVRCFGGQIAADQVDTCCGLEQQGSYVVWREHALHDKLAHQRLEDKSLAVA